jgi:hypothetical protein
MSRKEDARLPTVIDLRSARRNTVMKPRNAREKELLRLFHELPPRAQKEFMAVVEALHRRHIEEQVKKSGQKVLSFQSANQQSAE